MNKSDSSNTSYCPDCDELMDIKSNVCPNCGSRLLKDPKDIKPVNVRLADDVVSVLKSLDKPFAMTTDIAEGLDVTAQTVRNNAKMLEMDERINKEKVGQATVYWTEVE